jgi:hypothetical protein
MRTTVTLDKDVAAAVQQLRRKEDIGLSEAVNRIARAGLAVKADRPQFVQQTIDMGPFNVDVSNVAEALEILEGPNHK